MVNDLRSRVAQDTQFQGDYTLSAEAITLVESQIVPQRQLEGVQIRTSKKTN